MKIRILLLGLLALVALVCAGNVHAQGGAYQGQVFGPNGAPKGGATITVCNSSGSTLLNCPGSGNVNLASIYTNPTLTLPSVNPLTADGLGNFTFFAAPGIYYYTITNAGSTSPGPYIAIVPCVIGASGCGTAEFLPCTLVASSLTPTFQASSSACYTMPITGNTTISVGGSPVNGTVLRLQMTQCPAGGCTVTFPLNFNFPPNYTFPTAANSPVFLEWLYDGATWQPSVVWGGGASLSIPVTAAQGGTGSVSPAAHGVALGEGASTPFNFVLPTNNGQCFMSDPTNFATVDPSYQTCPGGGGGSPSQGAQGTIQAAGSAGAFQVTNLTELSNVLSINDETVIGGNNPYHDLRIDGARKMVATATPAIAGVTITMANGANTGTVSTQTCSSQTPTTCFQIKDGVTIVGPGAAHAMTTPVAPVLTPVLNGVMTGVPGETVTAPAGAIAYNAQIFEFNEFGGYTAASPTTTLTTSSTLGMQHVTITSCTRTNDSVTCTTATPHGLPIGCVAPVPFSGSVNRCPVVFQYNAGMSDVSFAGEKTVTSVADNTHYTYLDNQDTREGSSSSGTGGTLYWGQAVHYVLPAHSGDGQFYAACSDRATPGVFKVVGISWPKAAGFTNEGVLEFNDWGATMGGANPTLPWYIPTTCPTVAAADNLTTTITNVAGTTLTFAASAANAACASGGCNIVIDTAPILATKAAASPGYPIYFAPVGSSNTYYVFNSTVDLTGITVGPELIGGWVQINAPFMLGNARWLGYAYPAGRDMPSFTFGSYPVINCNAKPCIWFANPNNGGNEFGLFQVGQSGGGQNINIMQDSEGGSPGGYYHDIHSSVGSDLLGMTFVCRSSVSAGCPAHGSRINFFANTLAEGSSMTPLVMFNGETRFDQFNISGRGIFTRSSISIGFSHIQGGNTPFVTFTGQNNGTQGGNEGGQFLQLGWNGGIELDTIAHSAVAYLPGLGSAIGLDVRYTGNAASSNVPLFTGQRITSSVNPAGSLLQVQNRDVSGAVPGNCNDASFVGGANQVIPCYNQKFNKAVEIARNYTLFTDIAPPAQPTCSISAGGGIANGTYIYSIMPVWSDGSEGIKSSFTGNCVTTTGNNTITVNWTQLPVIPLAWNIYQSSGGGGAVRIRNDGGVNATSCNSQQIPGTVTSITLIANTNCAISPADAPSSGPFWVKNGTLAANVFNLNSFMDIAETADPGNPTGINGRLRIDNITNQLTCKLAGGVNCMPPQVYPSAGVPLSTGSAWGTSYAAPTGSLVGTGQSNVWTAGIQDFTAVSEFRPKDGTIAGLPATCLPPDVYFGTDAQAGRNWFFCTATNTWTQQLNSGFLALNTYGVPHTLNINESWANFTATTTVTVPHAVTPYSWVVYCVSPCGTLTLSPDAGNITLNNITAATVAITTGLGVEVSCDGSNCFAWGLSSTGSGSGTVGSCSVNGVAYYTAATTVNCTPAFTSPAGVPYFLTSTPSGGVTQPPALSLPGIVGRAVSGITAVDTIGNGTGTVGAPGGYTDCSPNRIEYIGSVAVAVGLPTATALGVPKCVFKMVNATVPPQTVTITPNIWTINGNATLQLTFGQQLWVYVDPNSATNWVADQTDLFGNVSGAAVPVSSKVLGTNANSQLIATALNSAHILVGNGSNLPADVAVSGDASLANTGAVTVTGVNGAVVPTSANVVGTNASKQIVQSTAHNIVLPWECADTSGSGSVQVCNTSPTFTPVAGDSIIYTTTTANTGASLTINVNSLGAKSVAKWQTTTTLVANDVRANTEVLMTYDGTNWEMSTIGNTPAGGGGTPCTLTALSIQYNNAGAFGCVAEFTYTSPTITASATGKIDLTSASVTAGFHLPAAAGAAPTNGGILSYDTTANNLVWGNATNTSKAAYITAAPTTLHLTEFNGTTGKVDDSGIATANVCAPGAYVAQTDAATVTWAIGSVMCANASLTFTVHSGSRTLNITNPVNGGTYILKLVQDATGGEGLTLGTGCTWKVSGGGAGVITLSTGASNIDVLSFTYDGTNCLANFNKLFN